MVHVHKKGGKAAVCQCLLSPWRTESQELGMVADQCICSTDEFGGEFVCFLDTAKTQTTQTNWASSAVRSPFAPWSGDISLFQCIS